MLWLKVLALFLAGTSNIIVGLAVLLRGARRLSNVSFFGLATSLAGWTLGIAFFLLTSSPHTAFLWAKIYYFFPLVIAISLVLFVKSFPSNTSIPRRWLWLVVGGFLLLAMPLIGIHGFVTEKLVYHSWGKEILLDKSDYLLYSVYLLVCYPSSLWVMYRTSRKERGLYAAQARLFFVGFLVAFVFGVTFNLFLPWFGNYRLIWAGPLFTSFFIATIAYSIIRHRMFDIRWVIARSLAYLAALIFLASVYGFIVFGIAQSVFDIHFAFAAQVFISAATGVAGLSFVYLRKLFDKATNRIFYRDAYDPQEFIDAFNKVLVSTIDLEDLLRGATQTIATYLKTQYCLIGIKDGDTGQRIFGTHEKSYPQEEIMQLRRITPHIHQKVIITDDISAEHGRLHRLLAKNNIAVLARITDRVEDTREGEGYIVLGPKKSGYPYGSQDSKVLEVVANELVIAIQNALRFEEIEQFNETLQKKVADATLKLRKTNEKLRLLDETKDDFIGMASHQLRTPLTAVKGYLSLVLDGDAGPIKPAQRKMLTQSYISSQRMVYLIADLLNVSRLRTGKFVIEPSPVNLANLVEDELEQIREMSEGRSLTLTYHKPSHFPVLNLDETKTRQVVMNFIDNAVHYTPPGGHITVSLEEKPQTVELRVVDDGIGVPKADQHHLFNKFYRAKNAQKARPDGTGLGLFMAKKVIVAQGGATIFDSKEGKGSVFGFSFPKAALERQAVEKAAYSAR